MCDICHAPKVPPTLWERCTQWAYGNATALSVWLVCAVVLVCFVLWAQSRRSK